MLTIKTIVSRAQPQRNRAIVMTNMVKSTLSKSAASNAGKSKANERRKSIPVIPLQPRFKNQPNQPNVGEDLTGRKIQRLEILQLLQQFYQRPHIKEMAIELGMDNSIYDQAFKSFQQYCVTTSPLPVDLHVIFSDILSGSGNVDDIYNPFIKYSRSIFPHLDCIEELKKISDLRLPPNWYPEARAIQRKIIFHCGPTNSGKTYHALERFLSAKSGVYCGPLKLLAVEVHAKANDRGTACDLVTGEERRLADPSGVPSPHNACTVEMVSTRDNCEVAVIDEIQMLRDSQRGWAWTRALLGVPAHEVHLCGEEAALDIVREILLPIGETVEVRKYKRLTKLTISDEPLQSLTNVRPGDCIVCFNKAELYATVLDLEKMGHEVAVIYGSLPPTSKLAQAKKFNDPTSKCKILVATDAIGMGLNLSINRVIFKSIEKLSINDKGEKEKQLISVSQALQIAGRAGRFGTDYSEGFVTTMNREDLQILKRVLAKTVDPIAAVGLHPTAEQIELFAYYLPKATLSNLVDIFVSLCQINSSNYFICDITPFKALAEMIQHINLPLRARYVFCCAPINLQYGFVCSMFTKFARQYSINEPVTIDWLSNQISWPIPMPRNITELASLEMVFDVLDLYLWLSYRFPDLFPDPELVRNLQKEIDSKIDKGLLHLARLINANVKTGKVASRTRRRVEPRAIEEELPRNERENGLEHSKSMDVSSETPIAKKLVQSGQISADLLAKLHKEWSKQNK
ncbi:ATP-dependent RNA helicase SUV3 homolog, mitochondrial-like [Tetranychus urticae]|uniref:ATP-dependent RNA helicase SUV3 homolog, mitochondrial n=1 Tax=Tetranychus urticae TaxID=32264 RepID=T1KZQ1_TETUR|nr:ATP-dependent RNA helicase SUV3 homolog, mitochondrial-like [Tetranychus urticae]